MSDIVKLFGNMTTREGVMNSIISNGLRPLIFAGPKGVGKFTTAVEFTKAMMGYCPTYKNGGYKSCGLCSSCLAMEGGNHPDYGIQTGADGITAAKSLAYSVSHRPYLAERGGFILDDADMMSVDGQNALLKALEEANDGKNAVVLIVHDLSKILPTVQSRCHIARFHPLRDVDMHGFLDERKYLYLGEFLPLFGGSPGRAVEAYDVALPSLISTFQRFQKSAVDGKVPKGMLEWWDRLTPNQLNWLVDWLLWQSSESGNGFEFGYVKEFKAYTLQACEMGFVDRTVRLDALMTFMREVGCESGVGGGP